MEKLNNNNSVTRLPGKHEILHCFQLGYTIKEIVEFFSVPERLVIRVIYGD